MSRRTGSLWLTKKFWNVVELLHASRFQSGIPRNSQSMAVTKFGNGYWDHPGLQFFSTYSNKSTETNVGVKDIKVQTPVPVPPPPRFTFPHWLRWILGSVLPLLLPLWKPKWVKLQRIEGEAEAVVEEVEKVANVVERVAIAAEEVAEEVAEKLPDNGKLKKAALVVESVSKQVAHDAHVTQEFIHKVNDLKNDLDDLEAIIEPSIQNSKARI